MFFKLKKIVSPAMIARKEQKGRDKIKKYETRTDNNNKIKD